MPGVEESRAERIAAVGYDYVGRSKEPVSVCNLCGQRETVEVSRSDRYGYPAVLVLCSRCGLGWLSPRLTAGEYASFYRNVYRPLVSAYHGRRIDAETVQKEQRDYAEDLVAFLRRTLQSPPRSVLDVGGSTGVVAGAVGEAFGAAATVLDPAPDELAVAEAHGMETVAGFAEDYDSAGRTWELVLLCQTIDHLLDVNATLRALRAMMAPDGHAYIDVLDVAFMLRRRGEIEGAVKIDHPYYLTRDTARAYFAQTGLQPLAERRSHDGHIGFLLGRTDPTEPNWTALRAGANALVDEIWARRAAG